MEISELVVQIQQGNTDAFAKVYDLYADRIFRYIRLKVSDQQSAEDILQEVFIKVWANCGSLQIQDMKFSAWVYKITSNTVNDFYRKKYRRPEQENIDDHLELATNESIENQLDTKFELVEVRNAFRQLPEQYREILELRYIQDFTLQETADILGKSNLAIRLLQHRALKKIQSILNSD